MFDNKYPISWWSRNFVLNLQPEILAIMNILELSEQESGERDEHLQEEFCAAVGNYKGDESGHLF